MNLTKTWPVGVLLLGGTLWAIRASAETEAWQDVWQEKATAAARAAPSRRLGAAGAETSADGLGPRPNAGSARNGSHSGRPMTDQLTRVPWKPSRLPTEPATPIQKHAGHGRGRRGHRAGRNPV